MTSIFVVRPFGTKPVAIRDRDGTGSTVEVDFEAVQRLLIDAAVARCGLACTTTAPIARAGNIRLDMFQMLIGYDLVIADISIDNANAFYELGIRHGLRPKGTVLIRFPTGRDVPFDLKTDRYVEYDRTRPGDAVDRLARAIEETIAGLEVRDSRPDSPVFLLLPRLVAPDPGRLLAVPEDFQEAVREAAAKPSDVAVPTLALLGREATAEPPDVAVPTLALLGREAEANAWSREGVRLVARAQTAGRHWKAARESWELILRSTPADVEANRRLGDVYWELKEPARSSRACERVLENEQARLEDRADALAQLARNDKALWVAAFDAAGEEAARRQAALGDPRLVKAFEGYAQAFLHDLNSSYAGINALALVSGIVALAERESDTFAGAFETDEAAAAALAGYREQRERLRATVRMSIERSRRVGGRDLDWLPSTEAQYALLTLTRPKAVAAAYRKARVEMGDSFRIASEARQVALFQRLGLFAENCAAALSELGIVPPEAGPARPAAAAARDRVIVATGHRADAAGRETPRFPNTQACIDRATGWLRETVAAERARTAGAISGIGGGASGTDLLFHEVCRELGIPTRVVLAIPEPDYRRASVADGGPDWLERFSALVAATPPIVLGDSDKLPSWAASIPQYGVHQRGNIWMMEAALLRPSTDVTLVALWNGQAGDGSGGTADMVTLAGAHGARTLVKNTDELFGLR